MLSSLREQRPKVWTVMAGVLLPLIAGTVDGVGLVLLGLFTSHMTGNTARLGNELDAHHWSAVRDIGCCILAFASGAAVAAMTMELPVRKRFAAAFGIEAVALCSAAALLRPGVAASMVLVTSALFCFAMGVQNGVTSRIAGLMVRTTHMTGVVTDLGLAIGRKLIGAKPGPDQTRSGFLHVVIFGSFLVGCATGAGLVRLAGWRAPMVPALAVLVLAIIDGLALLQPKLNARPNLRSP